MKMKSLSLAGTLALMTLIGGTTSAHAERRVRVVRASEVCAPVVSYHRDRGHHRGWQHRQQVVYVPVVTRPAAYRPAVYRQAAYRPVRQQANSGFYLHVSDAGTSFGIAMGR